MQVHSGLLSTWKKWKDRTCMAGTKKDGVGGGSGILASAKNRSAMLQKTLCSAVAADASG